MLAPGRVNMLDAPPCSEDVEGATVLAARPFAAMLASFEPPETVATTDVVDTAVVLAF